MRLQQYSSALFSGYSWMTVVSSAQSDLPSDPGHHADDGQHEDRLNETPHHRLPKQLLDRYLSGSDIYSSTLFFVVR